MGSPPWASRTWAGDPEALEQRLVLTNSPPIVMGSSFSFPIESNTPCTIFTLGSAYDAEGDPLSFTGVYLQDSDGYNPTQVGCYKPLGSIAIVGDAVVYTPPGAAYDAMSHYVTAWITVTDGQYQSSGGACITLVNTTPQPPNPPQPPIGDPTFQPPGDPQPPQPPQPPNPNNPNPPGDPTYQPPQPPNPQPPQPPNPQPPQPPNPQPPQPPNPQPPNPYQPPNPQPPVPPTNSTCGCGDTYPVDDAFEVGINQAVDLDLLANDVVGGNELEDFDFHVSFVGGTYSQFEVTHLGSFLDHVFLTESGAAYIQDCSGSSIYYFEFNNLQLQSYTQDTGDNHGTAVWAASTGLYFYKIGTLSPMALGSNITLTITGDINPESPTYELASGNLSFDLIPADPNDPLFVYGDRHMSLNFGGLDGLADGISEPYAQPYGTGTGSLSGGTPPDPHDVLNIATLSWSEETAHGMLSINPDGKSVHFVASADFTGMGTFSYQISHLGVLITPSATVTVNVVNHPPYFMNTSDLEFTIPSIWKAGTEVVKLKAVDPDGKDPWFKIISENGGEPVQFTMKPGTNPNRGTSSLVLQSDAINGILNGQERKDYELVIRVIDGSSSTVPTATATNTIRVVIHIAKVVVGLTGDNVGAAVIDQYPGQRDEITVSFVRVCDSESSDMQINLPVSFTSSIDYSKLNDYFETPSDGDNFVAPQTIFANRRQSDGAYVITIPGDMDRVTFTLKPKGSLTSIVEFDITLVNDDGYEPVGRNLLEDTAKPNAAQKLANKLDFTIYPKTVLYVQGDGDAAPVFYNDIHQRNLDDCYCLIALAAAAQADPRYITERIKYFPEAGFFEVFLWKPNTGITIGYPVSIDVTRGVSGAQMGDVDRMMNIAEIWPIVMEDALRQHMCECNQMPNPTWGEFNKTRGFEVTNYLFQSLTGGLDVLPAKALANRPLLFDADHHYEATNADSIYGEIQGIFGTINHPPVIAGTLGTTSFPRDPNLALGHLYLVIDVTATEITLWNPNYNAGLPNNATITLKKADYDHFLDGFYLAN